MIARTLLALLFAMLAASANATTTNFCDCGSGADPACVPGADTNTGATTLAGTTGPKQTWTAYQATWAAKGPGDVLQFCKGGAWNSVGWGTVRSTNGTVDQYSANPLITQSFTPTQFTSSAKPIWNLNAIGCTYNNVAEPCAAFALHQGAAAGGFIFRDLRIVGQDVAAQGGPTILSGAGTRNIIFDNLTIEHTDGAFGCSNQGGGVAPRNITIRNSTISYTLGNGMQSWGCVGTVIENNSFDHTANRPTDVPTKYRDHAIYISGDGVDKTNPNGGTTGMVVRHNTFTNTGLNAIGDAARCGTTVIVGHGRIGGMIVENNRIVQATGTASGYCYGIGLGAGGTGDAYEFDKQVTIRGNWLVNTGNVGITLTACTKCVIENNVIVKTETWDNFVGVQLDTMPIPISTVSNNVKVRNNSIFIKGTTGQTQGIWMGDWAGAGGYEVISNLVMFGSGGPGSNGSCFALATPPSNVSTWNHNLCFNAAKWATVPAIGLRACINSGAAGCEPLSPAPVAGTVMTVTAIPDLPLLPGMEVVPGTTIVAQLTGTTGGKGTYSVSVSQLRPEANMTTVTPGQTDYATRAAFTAATGFDANSLATDPQLLLGDPTLANGWTMKLQSTSPARNAGHATKSSPLAVGGYPKAGGRDIGAYEYGSNP